MFEAESSWRVRHGQHSSSECLSRSRSCLGMQSVRQMSSAANTKAPQGSQLLPREAVGGHLVRSEPAPRVPHRTRSPCGLCPVCVLIPSGPDGRCRSAGTLL
jgi:hypothetical protein